MASISYITWSEQQKGTTFIKHVLYSSDIHHFETQSTDSPTPIKAVFPCAIKTKSAFSTLAKPF